MENPPFLAIAVAYPPPVFEFRDDFDRQAFSREHPDNLVCSARTAPDIDPVGLEADESWQRQSAGALELGLRCAIGRRQKYGIFIAGCCDFPRQKQKRCGTCQHD